MVTAQRQLFNTCLEIQLMESKKRTVVKTIVYRILITVLLFSLLWLFSKNIYEVSLITIIFNISATIIYYFHERMWGKVNWENTIKTKQVLDL